MKKIINEPNLKKLFKGTKTKKSNAQDINLQGGCLLDKPGPYTELNLEKERKRDQIDIVNPLLS